ncbi:BIG/ATPase V1 complex, subunit S1 [Entophlyctis helioformis]|nr:BIG/ATPase V1 complex, subunit S1 [Entophlyctis helioformis]
MLSNVLWLSAVALSATVSASVPAADAGNAAGTASTPLLMWSNDEAIRLPSSMYAGSASTLAPVLQSQFDCSRSTAVLVHWPGLQTGDMLRFTKALPNLHHAYSSAKMSANIPRFVSEETAPVSAIQSILKDHCGQSMAVKRWTDADLEHNGIASAIMVELDNLSSSSSADKFDALERDDRLLRRALDKIGTAFPDSVVFVTSSETFVDTPADLVSWQMLHPTTSGQLMSRSRLLHATNRSAAGFAIKADPILNKRAQPSSSNLTIPYSKRSIFQKYVFFNDAIFMGITSTVILVVILVFGVRLLSGLQAPTRFDTYKKEK